MFTVSKMDPVFAPMAPDEVMGRHRGDENEGAWTTGACRPIPVVDPMQWEAARATLRSRTFNGTHALATPRVGDRWLRLSQQGFGAYIGPLLGCFEHMFV